MQTSRTAQPAADGVLSDNEGKDGPRGSEEILGDKKEALNGAGLEKEISYV